jgi:hypothetical protein
LPLPPLLCQWRISKWLNIQFKFIVYNKQRSAAGFPTVRLNGVEVSGHVVQGDFVFDGNFLKLFGGGKG